MVREPGTINIVELSFFHEIKNKRELKLLLLEFYFQLEKCHVE